MIVARTIVDRAHADQLRAACVAVALDLGGWSLTSPQFSHPRHSSPYCAEKCRSFACSFYRFCHNGSGREDRRVRPQAEVGSSVRNLVSFRTVQEPKNGPKLPFVFAGLVSYKFYPQSLAGNERRRNA